MTPDQLRTLRQSLGLSQPAMAELLGFAPRAMTVSDMETGRFAVTLQTAILASIIDLAPTPQEGVALLIKARKHAEGEGTA